MGVLTLELNILFNNIRVTCRDWFQLSLKEGLTVFRDQASTRIPVSYASI